jgi:hypothetical protein
MYADTADTLQMTSEHFSTAATPIPVMASASDCPGETTAMAMAMAMAEEKPILTRQTLRNRMMMLVRIILIPYIHT